MTAQTTQKDFLEKRRWGGNYTPTHHSTDRGNNNNTAQPRKETQTKTSNRQTTKNHTTNRNPKTEASNLEPEISTGL
jgi:hypothetical protein